jgi:hypothetical protein
VTADYTATEKAAIDLLDDAVAGLVDIHTDVAAIPTGAIPTANAIADQVWDEVLSGHTGAGSAGLALAGASAPAASAVADAVWDEALSGHVASGSAGLALAGASAPAASAVADAVWDEATSGHTGAGTAGLALTAANNGTAPTVGAIADQVWDELLAGHAISGSAGLALTGAGGSLGAGAVEFIYTVTAVGSGLPVSGVDVWVTTDSGGVNIIARGSTDIFGVITFWLDPGTYYFWRQVSGYTFTNPDTETVT